MSSWRQIVFTIILAGVAAAVLAIWVTGIRYQYRHNQMTEANNAELKDVALQIESLAIRIKALEDSPKEFDDKDIYDRLNLLSSWATVLAHRQGGELPSMNGTWDNPSNRITP